MRFLPNVRPNDEKGGSMLNSGMLLILLLLLIYTFGGSGSLTTENLTLIILALGFLVGSNQENTGCGCGVSN